MSDLNTDSPTGDDDYRLPEPIVDEETGVVIATTERERQQELHDAMGVLAEHARLARLASQARRVFDLTARTGDAPYATEDGFTVTPQLGKRGNRQVNPNAVESHRELLDPIGLAPTEVPCDRCNGTGVRERMPKVSEIDSKDARPRLARMGINADSLLIPGSDPKVVPEIGYPPEGEIA